MNADNEREALTLGEGRIRLTEACNYRCVFCHSEGGGVGRANRRPTAAGVQHLLTALLDRGCRDVTLTGGEPTLAKDLLLDTLAFLAHHPRHPGVTLVTNGTGIDDDVVRAMARCPKGKVHVSMHTADERDYLEVTGQRGTALTPRILLPRIQALAAAGVAVKLNAVMLRDINSQPEQLEALVDYARQSMAGHLKLIELLVVRANRRHYHRFYQSAGGIAHLVALHGPLLAATPRTASYQWEDGGPVVEITRCSCRLGCAECERHRAHTFTSASSYQPCFLQPGGSMPVQLGRLDKTLQAGRKQIAVMAGKYGTSSPSLIRDSAYVPACREYYFQITAAAARRMAHGAELTGQDSFADTYFDPPAGMRPMHIVRVKQRPTDKPRAKLLLTVQSSHRDGDWQVVEKTFLDPRQEAFQGSAETALGLPSSFGWSVGRSYGYTIRRYRRRGIDFSLSVIDGKLRLIQFNSETVARHRAIVKAWVRRYALQTLSQVLPPKISP